MAYKIVANGSEMGIFEGQTAEEAMTAYVRDAGYSTVSEAAQAQDQHEDEFRAEVRVIAVSDFLARVSAALDEFEPTRPAQGFAVSDDATGEIANVAFFAEGQTFAVSYQRAPAAPTPTTHHATKADALAAITEAAAA